VQAEPLPPVPEDARIPEEVRNSPEYKEFRERQRDDPTWREYEDGKRYAVEFEHLMPAFWSVKTKFANQDRRQFGTSFTEIPRISQCTYGTLVEGLAHLLRAALLNTWTTFESLATDLWIKAVDLRPKSLARNVVLGPKPNRQESQLSF